MYQHLQWNIKNVFKRNGSKAVFNPENIAVRIRAILPRCKHVNLDMLMEKLAPTIPDNTSTVDIDSQLAKLAASLNGTHPDYGRLGGIIMSTNLRRQLNMSFLESCRRLYEHVDQMNNKHAPLITKEFFDFVVNHADALEETIDHTRDYRFDYFSISTIMRLYLIRMDGVIAELPQFMFMRVAVNINRHIQGPIEYVLQELKYTYDLLSQGKCTFGSPTMYGSGCTGKANTASCYLLRITQDSIHEDGGIFDLVKQCAIISASGGGIGLAAGKVRSRGSPIGNGSSTAKGLVDVFELFGSNLKYADQKKRPGSVAMYVEIWHADIPELLREFLRSTSVAYSACRNVFLSLWINDLFMKRLESNDVWSFMCPHQCPGLDEVYGDDFEKLYLEYESKGMFKCQMPAQEVMNMIAISNSEVGVPYLCFKDTVNYFSNQKNVGIISNSNLCAEIVEVCGQSSQDISVCTLGTMCCPAYVETLMDGKVVDYNRPGSLLNENETRRFNFVQLLQDSQKVNRDLNNLIDANVYPLEGAKENNFHNRPVGLGIQGLSDVFMMLGMEYGSEESLDIVGRIAETNYFGSLRSSCDLAKSKKATYYNYQGSPISQGKFHWEYYGLARPDPTLDWQGLRKDIQQHGVYNSLVCAWPPTASTAVINGNTESFEPPITMTFVREVMGSLKYSVVNKHLVADLVKLGIYDQVRDNISRASGSIQGIDIIPDSLKRIYMTAFELDELDPFRVLDVAERAQHFVDQALSLNWFYQGMVDAQKMMMMLMVAHQKGLKTAKYYLHTKAASTRIDYGATKSAVTAATPSQNIIPKVSVSKNEKTHDPDEGEEKTEEPFVCKRLPGCEGCSG